MRVPHLPFKRPSLRVRWIKKSWRWLLTLRGSPEEVALGAALGIFVAFTPTIGFQWILCLALATLFRASRPAALIAVLITNPATIPPLFLTTYKVGTLFWEGPPSSQVFFKLVDLCKYLGTLRLFSFWDSFLELLKLSRGILIPLWIGGVLLGVLCGLATYPLALWAMRVFLRVRAARRLKRQQRRQGLPPDLAD